MVYSLSLSLSKGYGLGILTITCLRFLFVSSFLQYLNMMLCFCLPCGFYLCKIPAVILAFVPTNALSSRLVLKMFSFSSCLCFSRKCPLLTLCFFPMPVSLKFFFFGQIDSYFSSNLFIQILLHSHFWKV